MGNPDHLKELLKGVEHWNAWRAEQGEDFVPNFEGVDIDRAFVEAGVIDRRERAPLQGVNLLGANLRRAVLMGANLGEANLVWANLRRAALERANLSYADLKGANLGGAGLWGANLRGADLRRANLEVANLSATKLGLADMREASLAGAKLPDAKNELGGMDVRGVDLSETIGILRRSYTAMRGDANTKLPRNLPTPKKWLEEDLQDDEGQTSVEDALAAPIVKASAIEVDFNENGIDAKVPVGQEISAGDLGALCRRKRDALIDNTSDIAETISNKLGEATRADLHAYAAHLKTEEVANPHRLAFLAGAVAQDMADPMVNAGFDNRLKFQLSEFQRLHLDFLEHCVPEAHEAIQIKAETVLDKQISKEEATQILDALDAAILETEAATEAMQDVLRDLRAHDDALNQLKVRAYSENDQRRLDEAVEREAKELITFSARLYWRAREALVTFRGVAGDAAIVASISGKTIFDAARIVKEALTPLMKKLAEILTILPPI